MTVDKSCTANFTTLPTCLSGWSPGINTLGDFSATTVPANLCVKDTNLAGSYYWDAATTACNSVGGRLPNANEIAGMWYDVKYYGAYGGFTSFASTVNIWSSYTNPSDSTQAYYVSMYDTAEWFNHPGYASKTAYPLGVRCVKAI